ncbi:MAG: sporulation integral membrane protein YtvI [Oscillospiraceae bacterium]|jgi:sporulation integral membrane protein YtvI|nr:sporulation integral membrane protein YtvI [Oscillospiraceae bacterium]
MQLGEKSRARLGRIIDIVYYLLILVGFYLFMKYAFWLAFPFLFALFVAALLQRPMNFAQRKIKLKKSFSSVALVLLFYLLILLVIALIGARIWSAAKSFADYLSSQVQNLPRIIRGLELRINQLVAWLPDSLETRVNTWLADFTKNLLAGVNADGENVGVFGSLLSNINLAWFKAPMSGMLTMAGRLPMLAVAVIITVISSFFMTSGYDKIAGFLKRQLSPERRRALSAAKKIMFSSMAKLLRSYSILIGVSFFELVLGLLLLRFTGQYNGKYLLGIALATSFVDILPVLGVGTVLIPWSLYNLIMGNYGLGVGLAVLWATIVVVRQILEPKLVSANLGLPPIVTLMGIYTGLQLFGFAGMLLMPLLLILVKLLNDQGVLHIWKNE